MAWVCLRKTGKATTRDATLFGGGEALQEHELAKRGFFGADGAQRRGWASRPPDARALVAVSSYPCLSGLASTELHREREITGIGLWLQAVRNRDLFCPQRMAAARSAHEKLSDSA